MIAKVRRDKPLQLFKGTYKRTLLAKQIDILRRTHVHGSSEHALAAFKHESAMRVAENTAKEPVEIEPRSWPGPCQAPIAWLPPLQPSRVPPESCISSKALLVEVPFHESADHRQRFLHALPLRLVGDYLHQTVVVEIARTAESVIHQRPFFVVQAKVAFARAA